MLRNLEVLLNTRLFVLGGTEFTAWTVLYVALLVIVLILISRWLKRWLVHKILARREIDIGVRQAFAAIIQYLFRAYRRSCYPGHCGD